MTVSAGDCELRITEHPLQRCGAQAATMLAEARGTEYSTPAGLDAVADRLTSDIVHAATATNDGVAYDWWKVLFALYPNSPATHSKRSRDRGELGKVIGRLFAADPDGAGISPCAFCGLPAAVVWGKDKLPMFDSVKAVNTLPPRLPGWPVCRGCRIAMWALPYGAWVTAGSATVLTCPDADVELRFVRANVKRAQRIQLLGFTGLSPLASPETVTLGALKAHGGRSAVGTTLWMFKNDNQDAWLRVTVTRGGIPSFVRSLFADPGARAGWGALQGVLTERDKDGAVKTSGVAAAAKTLFESADQPGGQPGDRLPRELLRLAKDTDKLSGRTLTGWRALLRLYLEVIHQMDVGQVRPARELITDWITQERNPRGRFNQYVNAAGRAYDLQKMMVQASARLMLDGRQPADVSHLAPALFATDANGWRLRGLLFFDVVADLASKNVPIGRKPEAGGDDEDPISTRWDPDSVTGIESEDDRP